MSQDVRASVVEAFEVQQDRRREVVAAVAESWAVREAAVEGLRVADREWAKVWKSALGAGFSEDELRGLGVSRPGEGVKRRAASRSRRAVSSGGGSGGGGE